MTETTPSPLGNVITIDDERIKSHLDRVVRGSVENALLDAEGDRLCNAQRYERSEARRDTRAGHYERKLQTQDKAGWSGFLKHHKERGLRGVRLIISDACMDASGYIFCRLAPTPDLNPKKRRG